MSVYSLNKIMYLLEMDAAFRERMKSNANQTIDEFPLTPTERQVLTTGDIGNLFKMGVHPLLLSVLSRQELFGVNRDNYTPRIRGEEDPN